MPEDFSKVFTIELNGSKGWEVIWTSHSLTDAVNMFRKECINSDGEYRLTSPATGTGTLDADAPSSVYEHREEVQ